MTFIVEWLLAVLKDLQWLTFIDTLLVFLVNYLMFNAAGRVKVSWRLLLVGGLISSCSDTNSSYRIQIFA